MNYIILNGINSTTIKGLLIQTLPPITKPLMRTQTDTVDGRDGDIVTPLGFSAYDRSFSIGLYGNYDVNRVIEFFTSEGVAIFSNEPDKVYQYAIYAQIDFEKLLRFKTATVKMHVQPFKYSAAENTVLHDNNRIVYMDTVRSQNGVTAAITDGKLTVFGTASSSATLYVPIPTISASPGEYVLRSYAHGTNVDHMELALVTESPYTPFASDTIEVAADAVQMLEGTVSSNTAYKFLRINVAAGTIDAELNVQFCGADDDGFFISNNGNYLSKPQLTVYGAGTVQIYVNGTQIFTVELGNDGYITLDAGSSDAYRGAVLKNRSVKGNYDKFVLKPGRNTITYGGMVTGLEISRYSRWI